VCRANLQKNPHTTCIDSVLKVLQNHKYQEVIGMKVNHESFIQKFKKSSLSVESDIDSFMELVDIDCEWTIMATGEKFHGIEAVRKLAQRSVAARYHTKEIKIEPTSLFTTDDYFVIEYTHHAIVTADWPASTNRPAPGTTISVPICIIAHFKNEKFDWLHEYFDMATASGVTGQKLYS
jgi:hypothetical protein